MIYDAATAKPTQARIRLRDGLIAASRTYEEKTSGGKKKDGDNSSGKPAEINVVPSAIPASFNPIIRLEWTSPEKLFFETAYIRLMPGEPITTFQRWHLVILSPQAALLR